MSTELARRSVNKSVEKEVSLLKRRLRDTVFEVFLPAYIEHFAKELTRSIVDVTGVEERAIIYEAGFSPRDVVEHKLKLARHGIDKVYEARGELYYRATFHKHENGAIREYDVLVEADAHGIGDTPRMFGLLILDIAEPVKIDIDVKTRRA